MQAQAPPEPKPEPIEKVLAEYHKPGYLGYTLRYYEYKDLVQLTFEDPNTRDRIWCMSNFCAAINTHSDSETELSMIKGGQA